MFLVAVAVKPYYSLEHISLLPFLFALQPLIYILDFLGKDSKNTSKLKTALWTLVFFLMVFPPVLRLTLFSPIFEKSFICLVAFTGFFMIWKNLYKPYNHFKYWARVFMIFSSFSFLTSTPKISMNFLKKHRPGIQNLC